MCFRFQVKVDGFQMMKRIARFRTLSDDASI